MCAATNKNEAVLRNQWFVQYMFVYYRILLSRMSSCLVLCSFMYVLGLGEIYKLGNWLLNSLFYFNVLTAAHNEKSLQQNDI